MALKREIKNTSINRAKEMINSCDDLEFLKPCADLIKRMIDIEETKEHILKMQENLVKMEENLLCDDSSIVFSFLLAGLEPSEIGPVGDSVKGRLSILQKKENERKEKEDFEKRKLEKVENNNDNSENVA